MFPSEKTCCFTGHRPAKLPWGHREDDPRCLDLKYELSRRLEDIYARGYRHFICGMALGCDFYFAEAVLALKDIHGDVTLEAAIPCADQSERWNAAQRRRYDDILSGCDLLHYLQNSYSPGCMQRRNEYMVKHSSLLLACFDGRPGGTMSTILTAQRAGLSVEIVDVETN